MDIATCNGRTDLVVTIGCLAGCTRDIIDQATVGYENGADLALVLVPSVFHWSMTPKAIVDFFLDIANRSPVPIVIYNFPNLVSGLDVNQDMMDELAAHPNMAGVKLTCGNVSKMARVAAQYDPSQFAAVSGQSDIIVSALAAGGAGTISGVVNLFPRVSQCKLLHGKPVLITHYSQVLLDIFNLYNAGKLAEAIALQKQVSGPEWGIGSSDVSGMKWIIAKERGYPLASADCRRPFPRFDNIEKQKRVVDYVAPLLPLEAALEARAQKKDKAGVQ